MDKNPQRRSRKVPCFDHEDVKNSTRMERPVKVEEFDIDYRVPGLSHANVKEAEHFRVQDPVKKIENHLHRKSFKPVCSIIACTHPFSNNSKAMICELGNVVLFELCETNTKRTMFSLSYWNRGVV